MFFGTSLFVSQLKNGKWYIKGDMEKICQLFGASTRAELKRFIDRTLGRKYAMVYSPSVIREMRFLNY